MTSKVRNSTYICTDCDVSFELLSWPGKDVRKKYCPMCGDDAAVRAIRPKYKADGKTPWTYKEMQWLDECVAGNLSIYMLAHKSGRKISAIRSRVGRRREELGIQSDRPSWTDYDRSIAEKCLNKEITMEDVAELTGKSFSAVRSHICRERKKRRKENENHIERAN